MNAKRILLPTDFSTASDAALAFATSLARDSGATLWIVHVEEPPLAYGGGDLYYGVPEPDREDLTVMLERLVPSDPQVPHEHRLLMGSPATEIVRLADEQNIDLIVMGTHGRTGLRRLLMGSVAEAVVRRAKCPVLTLRQPQQAPVKAE